MKNQAQTLKSSSNVWNCENGYRADVFEKIVLKNNSFQYEYRDTAGNQEKHQGTYRVLKDGFVLEENSKEEEPWRVEYVYLEIIKNPKFSSRYSQKRVFCKPVFHRKFTILLGFI